MAHSYTNLLYHIVFSTNMRLRSLEPPVRSKLHAYITGAIAKQGGHVIAVDGTADHVHILARLRPDKAVSDTMRDVKAYSSKWIRKTFDGYGTFAWQQGYSAFTVSASQKGRVGQYIRNQERHHQKASFDEELVAILDAHSIEYDPQYLLS